MEVDHKKGRKTVGFWGRENYSGTLRCTSLRYVDVALNKEGKTVIVVRQTNMWALILLLPLKLCGWDEPPSYRVFHQGCEIGCSVLTASSHRYEFQIKGYTYMLYRHSHNVGSLTKNGRQIARYEWNYKGPVEIDYAEEHDLETVLAFAMFFYGAFHARKAGWHDCVLLHDEYEHLAHWKSQDN